MINLETTQRKWASSRLEGRTSLIFSSYPRCSRLTTETSGTRSGGLWKGQSPCKLLRGLSGLICRRCRGLRPCVEWVPETEESSPVLTWILGYFWSLPRGVSTGEESSGSGTDSTQDLRPLHRRERNPERASSNSHGDWPFLRPPERVPEVPAVSREHLLQLEKIQEVLPSRRDEAHFR